MLFTYDYLQVSPWGFDHWLGFGMEKDVSLCSFEQVSWNEQVSVRSFLSVNNDFDLCDVIIC
jgi:hypothetical protein